MSLADLLWPEKTPLSREELDRRARIIHDRLAVLEAFAPDWGEEVNLLRSVGLDRINNALLPAYQQIIEIANLGALLSTTSDSEVAIGNGAKTFVVPETKRLNFAPTPYLIAYANGDFDLSITGQLSSYDSETGQLVIAVESFKGDGTFASWTIGPVATTADLEVLRDQVQANMAAAQVSENSAAASAAAAASSAAASASSAADSASSATDAANTLTTFQEVWHGARITEPQGAELGAQYLDVSQTPNVVKVLTQTGWAPTVTISIGGSRQQVYVATAGQTGPFTVDGGFTNGSVNINGVELVHGHGVTLDAVAGTFTLNQGRTAGDVIVFRGYLANDAADIYVKAEADQRFLTGKQAQAFTAAEKSRARGNIGADVLGGMRNKIINGDFDIWQRSTSFTYAGSGAGTFQADRWRLSGNMSGTTVTVSRQEHTPGQTDVPGHPKYFARLDRTATGANNTSLLQRIEGVRALAGKQVTLTYFVKGTNGKQIEVNYGQVFGVSASVVASIQTAVPLTGAWVKHQHVFTLPSIAGKTLGANGADYVYFEFNIPANQGNTTLDLSHVSLVEGDTTGETDPFTPRHVQQELALCRRYFERQGGELAGGSYYVGYCRSASTGRVVVIYQPKRAVPTISFNSPTSFVVFTTVNNFCTAVSASDIMTDRALVSATTSGLTQGVGCQLNFADISAYIDIDAEL